MSDCNGHQEPPVSIFIDHSSSEEDVDLVKSGLTHHVRRNILAFDDAVLEMDEEGFDSECPESDQEDTQSRSSSTDLNNFLQIKQVKW